MERLTRRDSHGRAYFDNDGVLIRGANGTFHQKKDVTAHYIHDRFVALDKVIDRLAAYEDTGLEPEEIDSVFIHGVIEENRRFKEFAQAEKEGRLVAYMPGDEVYDRFGAPWIVESSEVHLIGAGIKYLYRCGHPGTDDYRAMYEEEILTREEAEAALKKREEADNEAD